MVEFKIPVPKWDRFFGFKVSPGSLSRGWFSYPCVWLNKWNYITWRSDHYSRRYSCKKSLWYAHNTEEKISFHGAPLNTWHSADHHSFSAPGSSFLGGLRTNFSFQRSTYTPEVYKRADFYKNIVLGQGSLSFEASSCGLWIKFEASCFRAVATSSAVGDQHLPPEESLSPLHSLRLPHSRAPLLATPPPRKAKDQFICLKRFVSLLLSLMTKH